LVRSKDIGKTKERLLKSGRYLCSSETGGPNAGKPGYTPKTREEGSDSHNREAYTRCKPMPNRGRKPVLRAI